MHTNENQLLQGVDSLQKEIWEAVNKKYICKSIAELMHEELITPKKTGELENNQSVFLLETDQPNIQYQFSAKARVMDHWQVDVGSIVKIVDSKEIAANDALAFYLEIQKTMGIEPFTLTHFLEETYNTLYADAFIQSKGRYKAEVLIDKDSQTIEHHMDGHPWATGALALAKTIITDMYQKPMLPYSYLG